MPENLVTYGQSQAEEVTRKQVSCFNLKLKVCVPNKKER
jgi:hypothetical protein